MEYKKSLEKAAVLLGLDGLFPPSTGAPVSYADGTMVVQKEPVEKAAEGF